MNKAALRKQLKSILLNLPSERKRQAQKEAVKTLIQLTSSLKIVGSFAPYEDEIDIWPFNEHLAHQQRLALPVVTGDGLAFYRVTQISELKPSRWNIFEPEILGPPLNVAALDLIIVPGLAFDKEGYRLGRGKGFYDTFIGQHNPRKTLGVGYKEQCSTTPLPKELHDQKLNQALLF